MHPRQSDLNFRGSLTGRRGGRARKAFLLRCCLTDWVCRQLLLAGDIMRSINTESAQTSAGLLRQDELRGCSRVPAAATELGLPRTALPLGELCLGRWHRVSAVFVPRSSGCDQGRDWPCCLGSGTGEVTACHQAWFLGYFGEFLQVSVCPIAVRTVPSIPAPHSQNPRTVWVARGTKAHLIPSPPAMDRDTFH